MEVERRLSRRVPEALKHTHLSRWRAHSRGIDQPLEARLNYPTAGIEVLEHEAHDAGSMLRRGPDRRLAMAGASIRGGSR